jgi:hypothetical protein
MIPWVLTTGLGGKVDDWKNEMLADVRDDAKRGFLDL